MIDPEGSSFAHAAEQERVAARNLGLPSVSGGSPMVLFLDDQKERFHALRDRVGTRGWRIRWAKTADEAIGLLDSGRDGVYDLIMLDHDLNEGHYSAFHGYGEYGPGTGMDVAKWIAKNPDRFRKAKILAHTLNPVGSENIVSELKGAGLDAYAMPWAWEKL